MVRSQKHRTIKGCYFAVRKKKRKAVIAGLKTHRGFALLIVLIAVAIIMILYMVNMSAIFQLGSGHKPTEKPLWDEENRILGPNVFIRLPKPPKPSLNEPVSLTATVTRNGKYRGDITIEFNTIGEVTGTWLSSYEHIGDKYTFEADFAGNIDISKTYVVDGKTDKSKLYFITKGKYIQTVFNKKTENLSATEGIIYVAGWLRPDYSAAGRIVITTDKTWSAEYLWQSEE